MLRNALTFEAGAVKRHKVSFYLLFRSIYFNYIFSRLVSLVLRLGLKRRVFSAVLWGLYILKRFFSTNRFTSWVLPINNKSYKTYRPLMPKLYTRSYDDFFLFKMYSSKLRPDFYLNKINNKVRRFQKSRFKGQARGHLSYHYSTFKLFSSYCLYTSLATVVLPLGCYAVLFFMAYVTCLHILCVCGLLLGDVLVKSLPKWHFRPEPVVSDLHRRPILSIQRATAFKRKPSLLFRPDSKYKIFSPFVFRFLFKVGVKCAFKERYFQYRASYNFRRLVGVFYNSGLIVLRSKLFFKQLYTSAVRYTNICKKKTKCTISVNSINLFKNVGCVYNVQSIYSTKLSSKYSLRRVVIVRKFYSDSNIIALFEDVLVFLSSRYALTARRVSRNWVSYTSHNTLLGGSLAEILPYFLFFKFFFIRRAFKEQKIKNLPEFIFNVFAGILLKRRLAWGGMLSHQSLMFKRRPRVYRNRYFKF